MLLPCNSILIQKCNWSDKVSPSIKVKLTTFYKWYTILLAENKNHYSFLTKTRWLLITSKIHFTFSKSKSKTKLYHISGAILLFFYKYNFDIERQWLGFMADLRLMQKELTRAVIGVKVTHSVQSQLIHCRFIFEKTIHYDRKLWAWWKYSILIRKWACNYVGSRDCSSYSL